MNRQPRLESILEKLHIPDFMYLSPQPAAESARRVRRKEQRSSAAKVGGQMAAAQTIELDHIADSGLTNPSPEQATAASFEPEPTVPEEQNWHS